MRFARGIMRTAAAARAVGGGIRLNRTAGLTESLRTVNTPSLSGTASDGTYAIWFRLHAISGVQCIFTSYDNSFRLAWIEVDGSGNLYGYHTVNTAGANSGRIDIATGIVANTWYCLSGLSRSTGGPFTHQLFLNGELRWSKTAVSAEFSWFHNGLTLGARRFSSAAEPGSGGQLIGSSSHGYHNHANATFYGVMVSEFRSINAAVHAMLWNGGNGLHPLRTRLAGLTWNHWFSFEESRLSGGAFTPVVGTLGMSLVQSSFQTLQFSRRLGTLIY